MKATIPGTFGLKLLLNYWNFNEFILYFQIFYV